MPRLLLALVLVLESACTPKTTQEEKELRRDLRQAVREKSHGQAAAVARRILQSDYRDEHAWVQLVRAQIRMRDLAGAKQTLDEWRHAAPKPSAKFDELVGDVAIRQEDAALAFAAWSRASAARPKDLRLLNKMARAHRARGEWQDEDAMLGAMLAIEENATVRIESALCRRKMHRWPEALEDYRRAQTLAPEDLDVRRAAKLFERLGKFLAEIRELDARIAMTPDDDQLLSDRALIFLRSEDHELALADSEAAAKKAAWATRPRLFRAIALTELGRAADPGADSRMRLAALSPEFLETISRLDAEISVERDNAELYVTRAWQLNEIGQPTLALEDAENALRYDPKSAGAHAESSYAVSKLGRADEAFAQIKRATDLDANFATAWHYRGELEMARGDYTAAIESLSKSLAINQTAAALQKREECYVKVGLLQKAEEDHRALEALR